MAEAVPWSPAREPYAIAVSQSWWFFQATAQFAADAERSTGPSQQVYARQIFSHLRGLRRCAEMQEAEDIQAQVADRLALQLPGPAIYAAGGSVDASAQTGTSGGSPDEGAS
jgi:hypothetical protein